jgi:hypothetical protein
VHVTTETPTQPATWWQCEPKRFARDTAEVADAFPALVWDATGAGRWAGRLPIWPFDRPEPPGLSELIGGVGLEVLVAYGHAYPVVRPAIYPLDPQPEFLERTQHTWHVNGDGSLCLLQNEATWTARDTIVELLLKAAGWRVEYALMKTGAIDAMSERGIVEDASFDHLMPQTVEASKQDGDDTR